ncbi:MAG: hypothetical protein NZU63_15170 [Gemmataceae bacterium]|nr:hypothetical protein [Gemmataceae bacterium]MDW8244934.1 hypothetical protein [Thermogemmata sp.]
MCAQRLSASLHSTLECQDVIETLDTSAQRLSASLHSTHCRTVQPLLPNKCVLNAFRHHCIQHFGKESSRTYRNPVLNAFRHHCIQHNRAENGGENCHICAQRLSASLHSTRGRNEKD